MSSIDEVLRATRDAAPRRIAMLTGAGVSARSGIPTFRGAGGPWRDHQPVDALLEVRK